MCTVTLEASDAEVVTIPHSYRRCRSSRYPSCLYVTVPGRSNMNFPRNSVASSAILIFTALLFHADKYAAAEPAGLFSFIHDLIQYNIAGVPLIHEQTQWDFDPEVGKQRRARYEQESGHRGEIAIGKIGMGIGYKGPWGASV